jgi:trk system potassium uptake protein TrkH
LQGKWRDVLKNSEARAYLLIIIASGLIAGVSLITRLDALNPSAVERSFRYAFFHTASVLTTTGFSITDPAGFPPLAQTVIFCLMFIGGCSGSTAGGFKVIRHVILWKQTKNEMKKLLYPRGVFSIRIDQKVGRKDLVYNVAGFAFLYFALALGGTLMAAGGGMDVFDALNASLACLGNIGLGLDKLSSGAIIYESPAYVKWGLSFLMIAGRLELWTIFVLCMPDYWKR